MTLSAREAEARADKLRQVSKRMQAAVFGAAVELRGYYDLVLHEDLESSIDKYLDYQPFMASWHQRDDSGAHVRATPIVGCHQQGSTVGFAYAKLRRGESLAGAEGVNFHATDPTSGQRVWTEVGGTNSNIYEKTRAERGFSFGNGAGGAANGAASPPFHFGADMS